MRILAVTNLYPSPYKPGRATFNREQFQAIAQMHPMAVISPIFWTDELSARIYGVPAMGSRRTQEGLISVDYPRYFFPPRILRGLHADFFYWSIRRTFCRAVEEFRPDVILASWAYPDAWATLKLARQSGLPVVVKIHGSDVLVMAANGDLRQKRTAKALRQADGIIAVSQDLAEKAHRLGAQPENIRVVYNGIDTSVFRPGDAVEARKQLGLDPQMPMLLFVGNLLPVKGVDVLIRACDLLAKAGVDFNCCMVGEGAERNAIERQITALGLASRVKLMGRKAHRELPTWFQAASAVVLPSRSEGVPNVLLEASACGIPYVASRVGGISEISDLGRANLVTPEDPGQLADAIRNVLTSATGNCEPASRPQFRSHADAAKEIVEVLAEAAKSRVIRRASPGASLRLLATSDFGAAETPVCTKMARCSDPSVNSDFELRILAAQRPGSTRDALWDLTRNWMPDAMVAGHDSQDAPEIAKFASIVGLPFILNVNDPKKGSHSNSPLHAPSGCLKAADSVVVGNQTDADEVAQQGIERAKIHVIPEGISFNARQASEQNNMECLLEVIRPLITQARDSQQPWWTGHRGDRPKTKTPGRRSALRQLVRQALQMAAPSRLFLYRGPRKSNQVCLTFDDGPHPRYTPEILDILAKYRVKATFFVVGRVAERYPEILRRMISEGHLLANHSFFHADLRLISTDQMMDGAETNFTLIREFSRQAPRLYRPPRGKVSAAQLLSLWKRGYTVVLWNVDPRDYISESPADACRWFREHPLAGGDIVLLHDRLPIAAQLLPELIRDAHSRGLRFGRVDQWVGGEPRTHEHPVAAIEG